jgi:hypothetical protein
VKNSRGRRIFKISTPEACPVAHICNPSYLRGRVQEDQPGQKVSENPISANKNLGMVVCTCHSSHMGSINRIVAQFGLGINSIFNLKNTQSKKRLGGMAQVVEHLSSKCKALSSTSNTAKIFLSIYLPTYLHIISTLETVLTTLSASAPISLLSSPLLALGVTSSRKPS